MNRVLLGASVLLLIGLYLFYKEIPIAGEHTRLLRGVFGFTAGYALRQLWHVRELSISDPAPRPKWWVGTIILGLIVTILATALPLVLLIPPLVLIVHLTYVDTDPLARVLSHPILRYLGERSYSIYLIHTFAIEFTYRLLLYPTELAGGGFPLGSRLATTAGVFVVTLGLSEISYRLFEKPLRDRIRRSLSSAR